MATSGTYQFQPSIGELTLTAFDRCGLRGTQLLQEHFVSAQRESNLWLASISNRGPNLFAVDLITTPLLEGVATYDVPASTVMILDPYIRITSGAGDPIDRVISPLSRTDYASISNKEQQGQPTSFWFDRLIDPTITVWPAPDAAGPYTLRYYRYRQVQDANLKNGENVELPYLFLDAFVAGLAQRLARIWAPDRYAMLKGDADEAWQIAATQNTENVSLTIAPGIGSYYR